MRSTLPKTIGIIFLAAYCLLHTAYFIQAADYLSCPLGQTCTLGEFLFDDNYQPIATASCTLTSRDPSGAVYINSQALPPTADGWYGTTFPTNGLDEGVYRSQICCTADADYLCIDKSFKVVPGSSSLTATDVQNAVWNAPVASYSSTGTFGGHLQNLSNLSATDAANAIWNASAGAYNQSGTMGERLHNTSTLTGGDISTLLQSMSTLTAADVWNYTSRSLTNFGSLVGDMWSYSSRSLTDIQNIITSVWNHNDRSLTQTVSTDTSGLATKTDIQDIKTQLANLQAGGSLDYTDHDLLQKIAVQVIQNRDLLDALVNQPIIQSFIDEGDTPDLQAKIDQTKQIADRFYATKEQIQSRAGLIDLKYDKLTTTDVDTELQNLLKLLDGTPTDLAWLKDAWSGSLVDVLSANILAVKESLTTTRNLVAQNPTAVPLELKNTLSTIAELDKTVGDVTNNSSDPTLFGKWKSVTETAARLDANGQAIGALIAAWDQTTAPNRQNQMQTLTQNVLQINHLSNAQDILNEKAAKPENQERNQAISLQAINTINRTLLASIKGLPVKGLWLQDGSVVFRTLVTNPSERITQTVPVKFFLPKEIKEEAIIKSDPALKITFDPTQNALVTQASVDLGPQESRTFTIEVTDIWRVSKDELESLKKQGDELIKPLVKTAAFGQGTTLKSDVDVTLNKILAVLNVNRTPDARIRFFRESQIEIAGVQEKLNKLKDLVTESSSAQSVVTSMSLTQNLGIIAIIGVIIAAAIFMVMYLRILRAQALGNQPTTSLPTGSTYALPLNLAFANAGVRALHADRHRVNPRAIRATRTFMALVVILSSAIFTLTMLNIRANRLEAVKPTPSNVLGTSTGSNALVTPTPPATSPLPPGSPVALVVPKGSAVKLLDEPTPTSVSLLDLNNSLKATYLQTKDGYAQIEYTLADTPVIGWVPQGLLVPINH